MSSSSDLSQAVGFCSCNPFLKASRVVDLFCAGFWILPSFARVTTSLVRLFLSLSLAIHHFLQRGSTLVAHLLSLPTICLSVYDSIPIILSPSLPWNRSYTHTYAYTPSCHWSVSLPLLSSTRIRTWPRPRCSTCCLSPVPPSTPLSCQ